MIKILINYKLLNILLYYLLQELNANKILKFYLRLLSIVEQKVFRF